MNGPEPRRWGRIVDVCELLAISRPTYYRIRQTDPTAPLARRLPTGAVVEDLHEWNRWLEEKPFTKQRSPDQVAKIEPKQGL